MGNKLPYDPKDKGSILTYAKKLVGLSLRTACTVDMENTKRFSGKGNFGQTLEKFYFFYNPNSESQPDFPEVGLELKSTPLKRLKNNQFRAKERLVLNLIDYMKIVQQDFENSSFWFKNAHILLVFYLHEQGVDFLDYIIHIVDEWDFPDADKTIIKQDWELIKAKINAGKAHELSEGDTYYLGACPKGKDSSSKRSQPNSNQKAMQRAFSLKTSYVNHIIASIVDNTNLGYGKIIPSLKVRPGQTIEDAIITKYKKYYGKTIQEIQDILGVQVNSHAKQSYAILSNKIQKYEEINKAGIIVKTVVLPESNNPPKQSISFPPFKYEDIIEEDWETSNLKEMLENKFLFVFFQYDGTDIVLRKVKMWNMPYNDMLEAKKVWDKTREIIISGDIIKNINNGRRKTNFPGKHFNRIAHVRPHARNTTITYPLPVADKVTNDKEYTRHSFWLNNSYILEIYNS